MTDIYDGSVWKLFKEADDEGSENFFWNEVADSHLRLMLNLDWFQPYDGTIYSIGVIYAAICNLPAISDLSVKTCWLLEFYPDQVRSVCIK